GVRPRAVEVLLEDLVELAVATPVALRRLQQAPLALEPSRGVRDARHGSTPPLAAEHPAVRHGLLPVDDRRLAQLAPARRALVRQEVARVGAEPPDLAGLRHLEAL